MPFRADGEHERHLPRGDFSMSNKFVLTGTHNGDPLKVTYVPGITPGLTALTYQLGAATKVFTASHVDVSETPIGELVTVVLQSDLGAPAQDFSFVLPAHGP